MIERINDKPWGRRHAAAPTNSLRRQIEQQDQNEAEEHRLPLSMANSIRTISLPPCGPELISQHSDEIINKDNSFTLQPINVMQHALFPEHKIEKINAKNSIKVTITTNQ